MPFERRSIFIIHGNSIPIVFVFSAATAAVAAVDHLSKAKAIAIHPLLDACTRHPHTVLAVGKSEATTTMTAAAAILPPHNHPLLQPEH